MATLDGIPGAGHGTNSSRFLYPDWRQNLFVFLFQYLLMISPYQL